MNIKVLSAQLLGACVAGIALAGGVSQPSGMTADVYLTTKAAGKQLAKSGELHFGDALQPAEREACVFVDASKTYQSILGIGGALTDAAAETFYKLPKTKRQELLTAYYDPENGIGYSLGRTAINSCDFSSDSYTYVTNGDRELSSFNIAHDLKYRIPFIKEVLAAMGGRQFTLFASPWSPPAWMKSNNDVLHGGELKPEYFVSWANYYVKFIQAYQRNGIPIWGLTVQNEPMAVQSWESCNYTAEEERDFVKNYLGPILANAGLGEKKIIIWDHNRNLMYQRAEVILDDPAAAKYVWGVGFHWYAGDNFENVRRVTEAFPHVNLLLTEACLYPFRAGEFNRSDVGELYARSMIHDFNNGAVGWTDWNILLDEHGGPNHANNFCLAPIHANTKTGRLSFLSSYYYIGHFSKFVRPGAKRITSSSTTDNLLTTAFLNNDGQIAVVVMNSHDRAQPFWLWLQNKAAKSVSPAHSIMTIVVPQSESAAAPSCPTWECINESSIAGAHRSPL